MELGKIPPHDIEAEQAVLGSMLADSEAVNAAVEVLKEEAFYRDDNRVIYQAIINLYNKSEPIDILTLKDELESMNKFEQVGGYEYLASLPDKVPTTANVQKYIKIVEEKSILRNLIRTANEIIELGYNPTEDVEDIMDGAEKKIFDIMQSKNQKGYSPIKDVLVESFTKLEELYNRKQHITGVPTGFSELDYKTAGLHGSELILVAARPAMGKTAFALNIATNAALRGNAPVAIFSLEMSKDQLVNRILCSEAMVDSNKVRTGKLEEDDWIKLAGAIGPLSESEIYIDDTPGISVMEIRTKCRKLKKEKKIGLVVIDYLQLVQGSNKRIGSREQEISEISRSLKILAKEINVPVIALSQLSRAVEQRPDHRPMLSDLRESGAIEQDADIVMFLYRDDEDTTGEKFLYEGGISEYVRFINKGKTPLHDDIIHLTGEEDGVMFEVAMQYNTSYNDNIYSFVNNINTHDGGTHEEGVRRALTRVINSYARKNNLLKEKDDSLTGDDVKEGLTMIISCKHPNPQFEGQTKGRLGNSEVRKLADSVFSQGFERFLLEHPEDAKIIVNKALLACRARNAARKAREITRKTDLSTTNFFGKLSDCKSKDPKVSEIFIVEGDSAGGSAKKGRDSMTQAILPLRGKILNVEKARLDKALSNEEIRTIITAFGTGIGEEFDLSKLRYDKIIIMTDADVDGSHIRVLLLTLFYRFFKPIVEAGHVYAAQPPLFRIMHGKTRRYVLDEKEKEAYLATLPENVRNRAEIARMKGLGEMDAEELNETTMDINKRVLRRITVEDCVSADAIFEKLMGDDVEPRRAFIEENARYVKNLDI